MYCLCIFKKCACQDYMQDRNICMYYAYNAFNTFMHFIHVLCILHAYQKCMQVRNICMPEIYAY